MPTSVLRLLLLSATLALLPGMACARSRHQQADTVLGHPFYTETGRASWYGAFHDGRTTANGSSFDRSEFTAAHPSLKFGTIVQVTNLANRRMVKVQITDRGPHVKGRIIDVSAAAARELGMQHRGTARVRIRAFAYDQFPD